MRAQISSQKLTETLTLIQWSDGYWIYDKTLCMHIAVKAPTAQAAATTAFAYYQRRLQQSEDKLNDLKSKVDFFVSTVHQAD